MATHPYDYSILNHLKNEKKNEFICYKNCVGYRGGVVSSARKRVLMKEEARMGR
jgi:hypothetical protein